MSSPVGLQRPRNLPLDSAKTKSRVTFKEDTISRDTHASPNVLPSPRKFRCEADFRAKRKRTQSCSFSFDHFYPKRRKSSVLPSKFLLGGNITDPLNLEALDKGDSNKTSEDPIGGRCRRSGAVRVIIPPNINDPLNLDACSEDGDEQLADAISRQRRRRKSKKPKRKRRNSEPGGLSQCDEETVKGLYAPLEDAHASCDDLTLETSDNVPLSSGVEEDATVPTTVVPATLDTSSDKTGTTSAPVPPMMRAFSEPGITLSQNEETPPVSSSAQTIPPSANPRHPAQKKPRPKSENKIVSPVVPQPGVERKRHGSHQRHPSLDKTPHLSHSHLLPPKHVHPKNALFQYGNYNQYYGYRNQNQKGDARLKVFKKEWFVGKRVLDIGCNIGHITLSVARDFQPQQIIGIDIDATLVKVARKNIKHYMGNAPKLEDEFPSSMKLLYGSLGPPVDERGRRKFPYNVKFYQGDYTLESDALLDTVRPEFDTILCLSITKWIHYINGDEGLKRFFKRIFRNLKPGGMLILEPQAWASYKSKRKLTKEIFETYKTIRFFPCKFGEFLTKEVGFTFIKKISTHQHFAKGFERPIYVYVKPSTSDNVVKKEPCSCPPATSESSHSCKSPVHASSSVSSTEMPVPELVPDINSEMTGSDGVNDAPKVPRGGVSSEASVDVEQTKSVVVDSDSPTKHSPESSFCSDFSKTIKEAGDDKSTKPCPVEERTSSEDVPPPSEDLMDSQIKDSTPPQDHSQHDVPVSSETISSSSVSSETVPSSSVSSETVPSSSVSSETVPSSSVSSETIPSSSVLSETIPSSSVSSETVPSSSVSSETVPSSSVSSETVPSSSVSSETVPSSSVSSETIPSSSVSSSGNTEPAKVSEDKHETETKGL